MADVRERYTVHHAKDGDWFYSYIDAEGMLSVGYWPTEAEAVRAAQDALAERQVAQPSTAVETSPTPR
jgi:predicted RNase H-like HicB family nuclease